MAQKRAGGNWGVLNQANNAPTYYVSTGHGYSAKGNTIFENFTANTHIKGATIGVFGIDTAEKANTSGEGHQSAHSGWNLRTAFTGGRAGRVQYETLVTTKNITAPVTFDANTFTILPE